MILFDCRFTPTSLFEGGSPSLRGKEVLEDMIDKDFRHRETFHFARPDNDKVYFHEYVESGHKGVYVFRIAHHHVVINNNVLSRRRWRTESPYLYVIMDFTGEHPVIMIQKYDAVPTSKKEVILVLSENFNQLLFLYGLQMELKPSKTKTPLSRMLEQEMDAYNDLAPTIEELHGVDNIFKLLPQEIYQMNMNDINKNIEKMMNDFKGLFDGAHFTNTQINVVTGNDNHISYEAPKREEKQEDVSIELMGKAMDAAKSMVWGNAANAVFFCAMRDHHHYQGTMSQFEREAQRLGHTCPEGTLRAAFRDNAYMKKHVDKWRELGAPQRVLSLMEQFEASLTTILHE